MRTESDGPKVPRPCIRWESRLPNWKGAILGVVRFIDKHAGSRCLSLPAGIRGRILMTYTSCDLFPRTAVPFWCGVDTAAYIGSEIPKTSDFVGANRHLSLRRKILKFAYCRKNCTEFSQIMHSNECQQILFAGGPNTCITNARWQMILTTPNHPFLTLCVVFHIFVMSGDRNFKFGM